MVPTEVEEVSGRVLDEVGERGETLDGHLRGGDGGLEQGGLAHPVRSAEPLESGRVTRLEWVMPDVCHTFRTGHRIMIQVQSSWFPYIDRNPQTFCDIYRAKPADYRPATQRVYRAANAASGLRVLVAPK